jgi:hypothetical protein
MKYTTMEFGDNFVQGPDLTQQEWQETLTRHRKANIELLRAIFRKDLVVTKEQRAGIERAAHGIWDF